MKMLKGKVRFASDKIFKTQFGDRIKVVVDCNGSDFTVWGNNGDPIQALKKGEEVEMIELKPDKYQIFFPEPDQEAINKNFESCYSKEYLEELELKASDKGAIFKALINGLKKQLPDLKTNELAPYAMLIYKEIK
jgi:hypothetical protein